MRANIFSVYIFLPSVILLFIPFKLKHLAFNFEILVEIRTPVRRFLRISSTWLVSSFLSAPNLTPRESGTCDRDDQQLPYR
jgi:hypothetical protein